MFTTHEMGLQVAGTLIARGTGDTTEQRITFTSDKAVPAPKDWGTILFTETAVGASFDAKGSYVSGSLFEHCVVEYAGGGAAQGAIWAQSRRAPFVYHSTIRNNGVLGMRLVGPPKAGGGNEGVQEARVRESEISGNSISSSCNGDSCYGGGVYVNLSSSSGTATLSGNTLSGNSAGNSGNGGGGWIYLSVSSGTATLSGNTLSANSAGTSSNSGYGGGIYVFINSSSSGTATIRENQILDNTASRTEGGGAGGGIHIGQGQPTLRRNDLIGNAPRQLWDANTAPNPASRPHLDTRYHWWGTTDEAEIGRGIWDLNDDLGLEVVDWRPDLTVPVFPFSSNLPPAPPASPSPADNNNGPYVARNPTLSWSAGADPDPGDTVSYDVYLGASTDPQRVSAGQISTSYIPPALLERNTTYYWRVVARDSWGEETTSPRWSFTTGSSPGPILDPIGAKTVGEGQTLSFTISGSDPDRKPLTFSASNLPPGARFDPATRTFSWTPTLEQEGSYPGVRFQVSNGTYTASQEITLTVTHTNAPPSLDPIGNRQVNEGEVLSFTLSAGDPDGAGGLTFSASNFPSGASFDPAARRFSWTPTYDQAGTYAGVRFTVSDGFLTDSETIEIRVVNVNRVPILDPIGNQAVNEGQTLSFTITGADPDSDFLSFSAANLPAGAAFDPAARRFSWTPTFTQAGAYPGVRFSVSDGTFNDSEEITFTVHNVNAPPTANTQVTTTAEDTLAAIPLTGSDLDGDPLTFTVVTQPAHGILNGTAPNLTYTPAANFNGSDSFTFRVNDGAADSAPAAVTLTITPVNDAPVLAPIGDKSISEGQLLTFTLSASDVEGDPLTYSASNLPPGASFDPAARRFSWTPTYDQAGTYMGVRFAVSDGSFNDSEEITLTVHNVNRAPTANPQAVTTPEDTPVALTLTGSDPDGDGRLRDAYTADFLLDQADKARLQLASSHTGNLAWAILALLRYYQAQGGEKYLEAAIKIGEWIVANALDTRGAGGFTGGVDDTLQLLRWKSTEHNLDLYAALMRLYEATGERRWLGWAAHARSFLEAMWDEGEGRFWTGTLSDGVTLNREPIPLDVHAWAVLALGKEHAEGLAWAQKELRLEPCECGRLKGYRFSTGGQGCWFEGTAHLSLAQRVAGDATEADGLLGELREVQTSAPNGDGGGIVAACSDGVKTGYGWSYFNALHVGATAWYLLAERDVNPLEVPAISIGPSVSGTIQDSKKLPVSGIRIEARQADGTLVGVGLSDAQGNYKLELPAGQYTLTPIKETHLFSLVSRKVTIKSRDLGKVNFIAKVFSISGVIKDRKGKPLVGVDVLLQQGETIVDTRLTDAKGKYSFSLHNTGVYTVVPSRVGSHFDPESRDVILTKRNRGGINFKETP